MYVQVTNGSQVVHHWIPKISTFNTYTHLCSVKGTTPNIELRIYVHTLFNIFMYDIHTKYHLIVLLNVVVLALLFWTFICVIDLMVFVTFFTASSHGPINPTLSHLRSKGSYANHTFQCNILVLHLEMCWQLVKIFQTVKPPFSI